MPVVAYCFCTPVLQWKRVNPGAWFRKNNNIYYSLAQACLKILHLHTPLRGIFGPNSVSVAHYASFIRTKSPKKCDAQLTVSNFQTRFRAGP
ncbi:DUF6783 domain-containing protein [[Clostridium] symbiosum]|uniref:DUF6783 domain-containing protein n=1 Tax=Clostridium symbiosum TaxID=1512 RepID=UPI003218E9D9